MASTRIFGFNVDPLGHHNAAWRHPETDPHMLHSISYYQELAQLAEREGFDFVFQADGLNFDYTDSFNSWNVHAFEPLTRMTALAAATERIGLICTVSSTFVQPYNLARQLRSLDWICGGRAAWNIVTTADPKVADRFGIDQLPEHTTRYGIAEEALETVKLLWSSWEEGALTMDQESGQFVDPQRIKSEKYTGSVFSVEGPLNAPPGPSGQRPMIVQAGQSEDGREFAARHADFVYMIAQSHEAAKEYYQDIKQRAVQAGRRAEDIRVIFAIRVLVGPDDQSAQERALALNRLLPDQLTLRQLTKVVGYDFTQHDVNDPIPDPRILLKGARFHTQVKMIERLIKEEGLETIRELADRMNGGQGVLAIQGSPQSIAHELQAWSDAEVLDGFMILFQQTQVDAPRFCQEVLPLLRESGLMRLDSEGDFRTRCGIDAVAAGGAS